MKKRHMLDIPGPLVRRAMKEFNLSERGAVALSLMIHATDDEAKWEGMKSAASNTSEEELESMRFPITF